MTVGIQREANRKDIFKGWAGAWDWGGESLVSHMHSEALTSKEKQVGGLFVCLLVYGDSGTRTQVFKHARQTNILLLSYTPTPEPALGHDPPGNKEAFRITALAQQEPVF